MPLAVRPFVADARWSVVRVSPTGGTVWRLHRPDGEVYLKVAPEAAGGARRLERERDRLIWLAVSSDDAGGLGHGKGRAPDPAAGEAIEAASDVSSAFEVAGLVTAGLQIRRPGAGAGGSAAPVAASPIAASPIAGPTVPRVRAWATDAESGDAYLVTSPCPGTPASDRAHLGDIEAVIRMLATGLRRFHDQDSGDRPFLASVDELVAEAQDRVGRGLVDPARLSPAYRRYEPSRLFEILLETRPDDACGDDLVLVHGDPTLDNTLLDATAVRAYVDLDRAGVGDRYRDLAVIARDLAAQVSPHALGPFFDAYGIVWPDVRRLDFHVLLAELL